MCRIVEFYGGPIDGCADVFVAPLHPIVIIQSAISLPKRNWILKLIKLVTLANRPVRIPIYFYRLNHRGKNLGYEFAGFGFAADSRNKAGQVHIEGDTIQVQMQSIVNERESSDAPKNQTISDLYGT